MRFPLIHRKGLQTPANTHQFNSVSWTHTLKAVLLGCSVLVLQADISQYSVYSHSLWNIQTQLLEETRFSLNLKADSTPLAKRTHSRAVWRIRSFWVLDGNFKVFLKCLDLAGIMRFLLLHRKSLQTPANTHHFNSVSWTHPSKAVLLVCSVLVLQADISQYSVYSHSLWNIQTQVLDETRFSLSESQGRFSSLS